MIFDGPIIGVVISNYILTSESEIVSNDLIRFYNSEYVEFIRSTLGEYNIEEILLRSVVACNEMNSSMKCDPNLKIYLPLDSDAIKTKFEGTFQQNFVNNRLMNANCYGKFIIRNYLNIFFI